MAYTAQQFLDIIHEAVVEDMKRTKILASLTAAQGLIESNKGNSGLTKKANALFGIKANSKWKGATVTMSTKEEVNGQLITVQAKFRAYGSWAESINDHSDFLLTNKRYANLVGVTDYKLACKLIKDDGYATSSSYTKTLTDTIEKYALWLWDLEAIAADDGKVIDISPIPPYHIGKDYKLQADMYVRISPGGAHKRFSDLTKDGQKHGHSDSKGAILDSGTVVTVKEIRNLDGAIWLRIPSGWVCGIGKSGKVYIA